MNPEIYRTLRDVRDGHITLHVFVGRYDAFTGEPVEPYEGNTSADRAPAGNVLKSIPGWWRVLANDGWLRLPEPHEPSIWMLSDSALIAIAEQEASR